METTITEAFPTLPGEMKADYEEERILKSSSRGTVCLLRRKEDGQRFVFRRYTGDGSVYKALKDSQNPHLPRIFLAEEEDGETVVLEEYVAGDTLAYLLEGDLFNAKDAAKLLSQICEALKVLHSLGAVHRDIKPENIVVRGNTAVLIDFDAARLVKEGSETDTHILGTTGYAAPEQYGFSQTDVRADIYSMGILLNVMLTGQHPSVELTDGPLRKVVETCTAVNAKQRYRSAEQLQRALKYRTSHRRVVLPLGIAAALVLVLLLLLPGRKSVEIPDAVPTTASGETAAASEEMDSTTEESSATADYHFTTRFEYDLDGDGTTESYVFGVISTFNPMGGPNDPFNADEFTLTDWHTDSRTVAPAVWQLNSDGNLTEMPEFASLLTEESMTLVTIEQTGSETPEVREDSPAFGVWDKTITVTYNADTVGIWQYYATAVLDGQTLTAAGQSRQRTQEEFNALHG